MPVLNGPPATKQLRSLGCKCCIVGVTGNVMPDDIQDFLSHGANTVLAKPLSMLSLERTWEEYDRLQNNSNNT